MKRTAIVLLMALTACGSPTQPVATPQPPPSYGTQVPTERGSLPKAFGQHAAITSGADVVVDFVVNGPEKAQCNPYASEPKNGRYVMVKISAKTAADPNGVLPGLAFGAGWEYVSASGESTEASTIEAASCAFDAPLPVKPNRSYDFGIVLDVPNGPGVITFDPAGNGGWEWPLSA